ncbi:MAG TPA: HEAT repeat domain-containing protein [Bacteroidia bacterium]|nr:HEAT repeat domain-containing protein [Bacteroidia bacterium]
MAFYDLPKPERDKLVEHINNQILSGILKGKKEKITSYFADEDTYIRKTAYLAIGKIYVTNKDLHKKVLVLLEALLKEEDFKIRQTVVNAAGEIGKTDFEAVQHFFAIGLFDEHHSIRNAVIGSVKKMGEKNPKPVLKWAQKYLHHEDKEIRREICHGIELRGRTHPQDILPMLKELQHDKTKRVSSTLVHVLGQIAYKKGCLETVLADLKTWDNHDVIEKAIEEIIDVHDRYQNFSYYTQKQAKEIVTKAGY